MIICVIFQVSGSYITTSSGVEGEIKVFEVRDRSLHCVYVSENVRDMSGHPLHLRHVRSLCVRGDNLYYGDDGVNVKILTWKQGKGLLDVDDIRVFLEFIMFIASTLTVTY